MLLVCRKMKKQLECWYAKHQPSNRRFLPKDCENYIGVSYGEHQPVFKIYHDDNAERGLGYGCIIGI